MIPLDSIRMGIDLSIENAERLLKDARLLFEHKRYASATSLGALSLEEVGKAVLLVRDFLQNKDISSNRWEKIFLKHVRKLKAPMNYSELFGGTVEYVDEAGARKVIDGISKRLDWRKQRGFYVDWIKEKWWSPAKLPLNIFESWSDSLIGITEFHLNVLRNWIKTH